MKIRSLYCRQFAGIRNRELCFEDGINLIYGKNESGKSTLVNLLSRTLFQNARIDGRSDKEFKELYFPSARRDKAVKGDFIDGQISFDTEDGRYSLSKEWGSDARCMLETPSGMIRDRKQIEEVLKEALVYGEGVYADMLFSSQRNTDLALQLLLDATKKTDAKQELTNAVSQAFSESGGISGDAIEQAINLKIDELAGKHWDAERGEPVRNPRGRWANGLGEVLKAYYELQDKRNALDTIMRLEGELDERKKEYELSQAALNQNRQSYERFVAAMGDMKLQGLRKKEVERAQRELDIKKSALLAWPLLASGLERAKALSEEKSQRAILDQFEKVKGIHAELNALQSRIEARACPTKAELEQARTAASRLRMLESRLRGMDLNAAIKLFGEHSVSVTALRDGKALPINGGQLAITEAVKISILGVMELHLTPANLNVQDVESALNADKAMIAQLLEHFKVDSIEALEQLERSQYEAKNRLSSLSESLLLNLKGKPYEELEAEAQSISGHVRAEMNIHADIMEICRNGDLVSYIAKKEAALADYIDSFGSISELKLMVAEAELCLEKAKMELQASAELPPEYVGITDPDRQQMMMESRLKTMQANLEGAVHAKSRASAELEGYKRNLLGDPQDEYKAAERIFEEKKALLKHWLHILSVFEKQKQSMQSKPMQGLSDSFVRYLGIISSGRISSDFPSSEKLNMSIYSEDSLLDYGKLSEGTKETVSLAFRLAALDQLFPNGGGVIVLDDPFTDMDAERTIQACALLRECATRHQVIFLTCKEEYLPLLGGNEIRL